jgi:hypothetical protein
MKAGRDTRVTRDEGFPIYCALNGFDLPGFDAWLNALPECDLRKGVSERREMAYRAMLANDTAAALRHLEFLLLTWSHERREDFLVPLAKAGKKHKQAQAARREGVSVLSSAEKQRMCRQYEERVNNGEKYGAIKELSRLFNVSEKTVSATVKLKRIRK